VRAFDKPLGRAGQPFHLVAPYSTDQSTWLKTTFTDIYTGNDYAISTTGYDSRSAQVQTYRQIIERYLDHPDPRRLDEQGQRCTRRTTGLLSPRHIRAIHVEQIGEEANQLEELQAGLVDNAGDLYTHYDDQRRDTWQRYVLRTLSTLPRAQLARQTKMSQSALAEILVGRSRPHTANRNRLARVAHHHAAQQLQHWGLDFPSHRLAILHTYLEALGNRTDALLQCVRRAPGNAASKLLQSRLQTDRVPKATPVALSAAMALRRERRQRHCSDPTVRAG
jgi:hypothetical protein